MSKPEGGYKIDGDRNPFTGEAIPQLNADTWQHASITDLWEQMNVLNSRLYAVRQLQKPEYVAPLVLAIAQLEQTIRHRTASNESLIT